MRKLELLLFSMICLLGLCACSKEPAPTIATAVPTESTIQETASAEIPQTTESLENHNWAGVDAETRNFLTQQLTTFGTWYNLALTSNYISPEFIDPSLFFCLGIDGECVPFTSEELDIMEQEGFNRLALEGATHKLDSKQSDEILNQIFGISIKDLTHPESPRVDVNVVYLQSLDAYCAWSRSTTDLEQEFSHVELEDAILLENGDIEILYRLPSSKEGVVTFASSDGIWKVRSNIPLPDYKAYAINYSACDKTPWNPVIPLEISYDDYFSQERIYPKERDDEPRGWDRYFLTSDGQNYLIRQTIEPNSSVERDLLWVIPNVCVSDGITFRIAMSDHLYGIRGNEIIQMDYWGNIDVLFSDKTGTLSKMDPYTVPFMLEDQRVLFFLAGSGDHTGIYRVYLPNRQVDLFYDDLESFDVLSDGEGWGLPLFQYAYSNDELVWTRDNTAFLSHYDSLIKDKNSIFYGSDYESIDEMDWMGKLADAEDENPFLACYYNSKTNTYKDTVFGRALSEVTYSDLSALERVPWWK